MYSCNMKIRLMEDGHFPKKTFARFLKNHYLCNLIHIEHTYATRTKCHY